MNLWRRSKSWFQDSSQCSEANNEPTRQDRYHSVQQQEKAMVNERHETEKRMLGKHYQLLELKSRSDLEQLKSRKLHEPSLNRKGKNVAAEIKDAAALGGECREYKEKSLVFESDGLEWDPSDHEMQSYNEEDQISDSWEGGLHGDVLRRNSSILSPGHEDVESCDSAYSSLSTELQWKFVLDEDRSPMLNASYQNNDVERRMEELRLTMRREVIEECEEKFQRERNFLYSIIDELEESVSMLRKQKEDIVTIFEGEGKEGMAKNTEGEIIN